MLEWMVGLLVVAILIAKVLDAFEVIDLSELISEFVVGALKLTANLLFAVGAFFVHLMTRRSHEKQQ
jgi:hypothetical protein